MLKPPPPGLTRRAAIAGIGASCLVVSRQAMAQGASHPALPPASSVQGGRILTASPVRMRLRPDVSGEADLWLFDGRTPGPILRVRHGNELQLKLVNDAPKPLSLHWHGVRGPNAMDGVGGLTQDPVAPGKSFEYRFTPPDAGTFLIRPCILGGSAEPAARGLSGLLIIEETGAPGIDHDVAVLVDDWRLNEDGSLAPFGDPGEGTTAGRLGNWLSVNQQAIPERIEAAPGSRVRLRLANACNARVMRLRFDGMKPHVIAIDGQPTEAFEPLRATLPFPPGTRYDLLFTMPDEAGAIGMVTIGQSVALVRLATTTGQASAPRPLAPLPPNDKLPAAIRLQSAARKDVVIAGQGRAGTAGPWTINGAPGNPARPLLSVKRGTPVVLALMNKTDLAQPVHLHGHVFRLLHAYDDGWEPYFLDTLQVPENRTLHIAFVADNPGRWLIASTVLERFDAGLWAWIEVT
jgi:FtsP/CotA-like multicopper oxidase with cupredoxin domain